MKRALSLLFVLTLTSCGSKKQRVALPADFKGPKELSRLYGVRLTPDDNIFLYNEGAKWLGVPHRMGGLTKKGVDCSGFVAIVFREVYGKQLARSSADMLKHNCKKVNRANLKEGDLVFFSTYEPGASHVGIYAGKGMFWNASTSRGVVLDSLDNTYWKSHYYGARRILVDNGEV